MQVKLNNVISVHCGLYHTIIRTIDGIYTCGDNAIAQLGLYLNRRCASVPTKIFSYNNKLRLYDMSIFSPIVYDG